VIWKTPFSLEAHVSKCLVTGGAGFIGSHIAQALARKSHEVRILDNLSTGRLENVESFKNDVSIIKGDIRDRDVVADAVRGVDYVFHQAALASVPRSLKDPSSTNEVNVQGTLNILEAAKNERVKMVVYASSSSAYGDSKTLPKVENMVPDPKSPYAVSKLAGELYCRVFSQAYGLPTVSLRYFNVFGPRQDPASQYAAVIPIFVTSLIEGRSPTIFGDGEQSRDFTYIDDVVDANLLACRSKGLPGSVYNVACGGRITLNSLFDKVRTLIGTELAAEYGPARVGDVKHSQASIDAIRKDLGFVPKVTIDEGLRRTVEWYQKVRTVG
jgi:UDP-glucose 4-epimerase